MGGDRRPREPVRLRRSDACGAREHAGTGCAAGDRPGPHDAGLHIESVQPRRAFRRARPPVEPLEPRARRGAVRARRVPPRELHQEHVPRQPGDGGDSQQCHPRHDPAPWGGDAPSAKDHLGLTRRSHPHRRADRGRARLRDPYRRLAPAARPRAPVPGCRQPRLHAVPDRELQARFLEGIQHQPGREARLRPTERDAALAARRRGGRIPDLRAHHEEQGDAEDAPRFFNICVHKGLTPDPTPDPKLGHPSDVPKAAKDWPHLNFIIYHSCIQPRFFYHEPLQAIRSGRLRNGVPDINWTTAFAQLAAPFPNVYGEIGTTFASSVITFPTVSAHILGQLLKYFGPDRVVFGSDSIWYGSPQWQIETLWRFQIPDEMRKRWGYPELTQAAKRKILGLNSARLYGLSGATDAAPRGVYRPVPKTFESLIPDSLKTLMEFPGFTADNISRTRKEYLAMGGMPSHTRYGWVRRA